MSKGQQTSTKALGATPEIVHWGHFLVMDSNKINSNIDLDNFDLIKANSVTYSYMIMPRYGMNLH